MSNRTRNLHDPDVREVLAAAGFVPCPSRHAVWERIVQLAEQERRRAEPMPEAA